MDENEKVRHEKRVVWFQYFSGKVVEHIGCADDFSQPYNGRFAYEVHQSPRVHGSRWAVSAFLKGWRSGKLEGPVNLELFS